MSDLGRRISKARGLLIVKFIEWLKPSELGELGGPTPAFSNLGIEFKQTLQGPRHIIVAGTPTWTDMLTSLSTSISQAMIAVIITYQC